MATLNASVMGSAENAWAIAKIVRYTTLLAIRNMSDQEIYAIQIKVSDGAMRYAKIKGWDSKKIDSNTVMLATDDRHIGSGKTVVVLLRLEDPHSPVDWTI